MTLIRWTAPTYVRDRTEEENDKIREKFHILVSGDDIPPPIPEFKVGHDHLMFHSNGS
jgi:hypothetical protein